eukprot:7321786-Heterocapsa_arctica.AAC.1
MATAPHCRPVGRARPPAGKPPGQRSARPVQGKLAGQAGPVRPPPPLPPAVRPLLFSRRIA